MVEPDWPLLQLYLAPAPPPLPVSVVDVPWHMLTSAPAFAVTAFGLTITWMVSASMQPLFVTVTEYVVFVAGVTLIDCVVAPFDQVFPVVEEEVKVTEPPAQKVVGPPAVMVGVAGSGFTVTIVAADVDEQDPLKTVTA